MKILDEVSYIKSKLGLDVGYLTITDEKRLTFTKYKNQLTGRMHVLALIVYKLVLLFLKDKEILNLDLSQVNEVVYEKVESTSKLLDKLKSNKLTLKTDAQDYVFTIPTHLDGTNEFIEELKSLIKQ